MKKWSVVVSGLIGLVGVTLLAAITLGGVSFMATVGSSMEPGFHAGDLAVLHRPANYGVGDVAAYRSHDLDTVVMHRITAVEGDRYTLRGDNNSWLDPEQPTRDQLLGKLAWRVPGGGAWLNRATSRTAIMAVSLLLLASGGTHTVVRRRRKRQRRAGTPTAIRPPPPRRIAAGVALIATSLGAGAFAALTWNAPGTLPATKPAPHATMTYSYTATVPASAAYDSTTVTQPQPIFRNVTDRVDLHFTYETGAVLTNATINVSADLSTASGWRSTLPLAGADTFSGQRRTGAVTLDLVAMQARADAAAEAIGDSPGGTVAVTVAAEVRTTDHAVFRSELPFVLDSLALRLAEGEETPLTVTEAVPVARGEAPGKLSSLGRFLQVQPSRSAAVIALALALLSAGGLVLLARRAFAAPEAASIHQRYGTLLLDVEPVALPAGRPVIEVPMMRGLARLAERYGLMVMHWHRGGVHTYVVFEEHTTYRFRTAITTSEDAPPDEQSDVPDEASDVSAVLPVPGVMAAPPPPPSAAPSRRPQRAGGQPGTRRRLSVPSRRRRRSAR